MKYIILPLSPTLAPAAIRFPVFSLNPANIFNQTVKTIATGGAPTGVAVLPRLAYTGQAASTAGGRCREQQFFQYRLRSRPGQLRSGQRRVRSSYQCECRHRSQRRGHRSGNEPGGHRQHRFEHRFHDRPHPANRHSYRRSCTHQRGVDQNPIASPLTRSRHQWPRPRRRNLPCAEWRLLTLRCSGRRRHRLVHARQIHFCFDFLPLLYANGVVFDPSVTPALFYAVSTQGNVITAFNPDAGTTQTIKVGINPNAIAYNFQTGTILTVNSLSNTISIVDSQTFTTKATLGIGAASKFAAAIETFTKPGGHRRSGQQPGDPVSVAEISGGLEEFLIREPSHCRAAWAILLSDCGKQTASVIL